MSLDTNTNDFYLPPITLSVENINIMYLYRSILTMVFNDIYQLCYTIGWDKIKIKIERNSLIRIVFASTTTSNIRVLVTASVTLVLAWFHWDRNFVARTSDERLECVRRRRDPREPGQSKATNKDKTASRLVGKSQRDIRSARNTRWFLLLPSI